MTSKSSTEERTWHRKLTSYPKSGKYRTGRKHRPNSCHAHPCNSPRLELREGVIGSPRRVTSLQHLSFVPSCVTIAYGCRGSVAFDVAFSIFSDTIFLDTTSALEHHEPSDDATEDGAIRQQAMEAKVDVRRITGLGQKNRKLPCTHGHCWLIGRRVGKRCGMWLGCGTARLPQGSRALVCNSWYDAGGVGCAENDQFTMAFAGMIRPSTIPTDNMRIVDGAVEERRKSSWTEAQGCGFMDKFHSNPSNFELKAFFRFMACARSMRMSFLSPQAHSSSVPAPHLPRGDFRRYATAHSAQGVLLHMLC